MNSAGRKKKRAERVKLGVAAFWSPLTALMVALSLIVQLVAIPYHQALVTPLYAPSATAAIAAELRATFGDRAALCVQVDDKGAPIAPAGHCDDQCPLCRFAAQAAALIAPDAPALPQRVNAGFQSLGAAPEPGSVPVCVNNRNRARAPPPNV